MMLKVNCEFCFAGENVNSYFEVHNEAIDN